MNTRKILTFAAGAVAASLAASTQAQTITSIQFTRGAYGQGTPLTSSQAAGVGAFSAANWNSARPSGHGLLSHDISDGVQETDTNLSGPDVATLVTSTGAASPINYSIVSYGNVNAGSGLPAGNDQVMLSTGGFHSRNWGLKSSSSRGSNDRRSYDRRQLHLYLLPKLQPACC